MITQIEAIKKTINIIKKHPSIYLVTLISYAAMTATLIAKQLNNANIYTLTAIITFLTNLIVSYAIIKLFNQSIKRRKISVKNELINGFNNLPRLFVITIIYAAIILAGLILLIIPGLILIIMLTYTTQVTVLTDKSIKEVIKESYKLGKNNFWSTTKLLTIIIIPVILLNLVNQTITMIITPLLTPIITGTITIYYLKGIKHAPSA